MHSAFITGAGGFVARHLGAYLHNQGLRLWGFDREPKDAHWPQEWVRGDVTNTKEVGAALQAAKPDYVFHLAALLKSDSLADLLFVNVVGTQCVLEGIAQSCPEARVLVAGSSAEYGLAPREELPIQENNPLRPRSSYGVSKVAQGLLAEQYAHSRGLTVVRSRTFNLTGPGEPETLVCSAFAKQIAEIRAGRRDRSIEVGNLEAGRDFLDVRDAVRAYWALATHGTAGEVYNVCSGASVSIGRILSTLIGFAGVPIKVKRSQLLYTKSDVPDQIGDSGKCRRLTGWAPTFNLDRSLQDLLSEWERRLAAL